MKITELYEGAEPRLPGAVSGIKVMTPQQFTGQADEELNEFAPVGGDDREPNEEEILRQLAAKWWLGTEQEMVKAQKTLEVMGWEIGQDESGDDDAGVFVIRVGDENGDSYIAFNHSDLELNEATAPEVDEGKGPLGQGDLGLALKSLGGSWSSWHEENSHDPDIEVYEYDDGEGGYYASGSIEHNLKTGEIEVHYQDGENDVDVDGTFNSIGDAMKALRGGNSYPSWGGKKPNFDRLGQRKQHGPDDLRKTDRTGRKGTLAGGPTNSLKQNIQWSKGKHGPKGVLPEGDKHLARIRRLSGLNEATALPAQSRELGGDEFQDYMTRIKGTDDLDKEGNVKLDKKGIAKYTTGKTKTDKYKMPYIHRSSAIEYYDEGGKRFKEEAVIQALQQRPKKLLKQNEKMKHSNGEFEQFFNVGFAALTGVAVDESTNKLIIVNTCPGAGSCKVDCFAMKGGKVQFKAAWLSDGRILTYLLNDPSGFFNQLSSEIASEEAAANKGDKKFPNGWQVTVRWHDAGDFFSPEYLELALNMAAKHPNVKFYAYTKMAGAALAKKPDNFIINWSEGANTTQEKQVKQQDPNLDNTKNSRIVPEKLFYDLLAKDEKGNLKKTADGAWQPASPEALVQMKQRIAKEYGISPSSILSYTEYMSKRNSIPAGMKYNVIVAPGEGDVSANDQGVLSTLLLRH